jgi:putative effector of murein hydrolase LrgA (UPF0299 family)
VIGMVLLLLVLIPRQGPSPGLRHTAGGLLQHLSLLFVPAGTGVMLHAHRLGDEGLAIMLALVASPLLGLTLAPLTLAMYVAARAFQLSQRAGAFAALAMGLNGLLTALALPAIRPWPGRLPNP